ncbi:MAG TPA: flippase-like domain-containing protein, partial [Longimicrobium sp.]|nr:flippase-like domain-containing protein [Longimicrobium sp.]
GALAARLRAAVARPGRRGVRRGARAGQGGWAALARAGAWKPALAAAALATGFDLACLWLLFAAAGRTPAFGVLLAGYGLPLLAGKIAIVPGGLGVVEGGMAAMYHALGIPAATAVTVVLAYRLLSFWLPNAVGFALIPWLQAAPRRSPRAAAGRRRRRRVTRLPGSRRLARGAAIHPAKPDTRNRAFPDKRSRAAR